MNPYQDIPVAQLKPSPTNPRKRFDPVKLSELADSIAQQGILQPIVVARPAGVQTTSPGEPGDCFEIVAGERRWRAAQEAGLEVVPCRVGTFSKAEIVEIQAVENLQREDLDPLEEAQGYANMLALKDDEGHLLYSQTKLAERLGVSQVTISHRVALLRLPAQTQALVSAGKLGARTAGLIARIPGEAERNKAALEISDPDAHDVDFCFSESDPGEPMTFKEAAEYIKQAYIRSLAHAPFDVGDETLYPAVGSCEACPKRSGNCKELYPDLDKPNLCLDTGCFAEKVQLANERLEAEAASKGQQVVDGNDVFQSWADQPQLQYNSPYVMLNQKPEPGLAAEGIDGRKLKPWSSLVKDRGVPVLIARHPRSGAVHELAKFDLALAAALENGHKALFRPEVSRRHEAGRKLDPKLATVDPKQEDKLAKERRKEKEATARRKRILTRAFDQLCDAVTKRIDAKHYASTEVPEGVGLGEAIYPELFWSSLLERLQRMVDFETANFIVDRHELNKDAHAYSAMGDYLKTAPAVTDPVLVMELLFGSVIASPSGGAQGGEDAFRDMLQAYGVSYPEIEAEIDEEIATEKKAAKAKTAAKKATKKRASKQASKA